MHEFTLCQQIIHQVESSIDGSNQVQTVNLVIGSIAAIDLSSLQFWFPVAAKETRLANADLHVEMVPARACCLECNHHFALEQRLKACPYCQSYRYQLLSGDELQIKNVEVL